MGNRIDRWLAKNWKGKDVVVASRGSLSDRAAFFN